MSVLPSKGLLYDRDYNGGGVPVISASKIKMAGKAASEVSLGDLPAKLVSVPWCAKLRRICCSAWGPDLGATAYGGNVVA